jgi:hypothetical protein
MSTSRLGTVVMYSYMFVAEVCIWNVANQKYARLNLSIKNPVSYPKQLRKKESV